MFSLYLVIVLTTKTFFSESFHITLAACISKHCISHPVPVMFIYVLLLKHKTFFPTEPAIGASSIFETKIRT